MKFNVNAGIIGLTIILVIINITVFVRGIALSDEIHYYEKELAQLKYQNVEYEQEIYKMSAFTLTASLAAELKYGNYNDPIYHEIPQYALNQ